MYEQFMNNTIRTFFEHVFGTYHLRRLWVTIVVVMLLTSGGHLYSVDEERMFTSTVQTWNVIQGWFGVDVVQPERIFTKYGPVQSFLALPLYGIGAVVSQYAPAGLETYLLRMFATWVNVFTSASAAVLLGWITLRRNFSTRVAYVVALAYAFGSMAWIYTSSFFSEPTAAFFLLATSIPIFLPASETTSRRWLIIAAGVATFFAIQTKAGIAFALPLIGISIAYIAYRDRDWPKIIYWGSSAVISGICFLLYNNYVYGGFFSTGYNNGTPSLRLSYILNGLHGQFLSSGKSVFLYNPIVFLWPLGILLQIRRRDFMTLVASLSTIAGVVVVHANVTYWHGDGAWGPRYLLMIIPFMLISVTDAVAWIGAQTRLYRFLIVVPLIVATLFVQLAGKLISINPYLINSAESNRYYNLTDSPILGHWRIILAQINEDIDQNTGIRVNLDGWAYSEGDRDAGQQFPRMGSSEASIIVYPPEQTYSFVKLRYHTCFAVDNPTSVALIINDTILIDQQVCPPRTHRLLLPPAVSTITLRSPGVQISGAIDQHKWYEYIGSVVQDLTVYDNTQIYPIKAPMIPPSQMPTGPVSLRVWLSDIRLGFYDFWWYYLTIVPVPSSRLPMLLIISGIIAFIGIVGWNWGWRPYQRQRAPQE